MHQIGFQLFDSARSQLPPCGESQRRGSIKILLACTRVAHLGWISVRLTLLLHSMPIYLLTSKRERYLIFH